MKILFLGETYRADAKTWVEGIEHFSGQKIDTLEVPFSKIRSKRIFFFFRFFIQLLILRVQKSYDIVLAERATSYGFFSLLIKSKIRVVAQQGITDAFPEEGLSGIYKRIFQRLVYENADLIHAWGHVMTYAMLETGAPPSRIMVLPKGINLNRYTFSPPSFEKKVPVGIVTRSLSTVYRHEDILQAYAILKSNNIEVKCWIVGDGVLKDKLIELANQLDLGESVQFLGKIDNAELPSLLLKSDFYLAVPETEGVSASLFEAMACGCYPIVTDLPANRAFIRHNQNGMLVPVGNPVHLANSIAKYLHNSKDYLAYIKQNRDYIEKKVNFDQNMKQIWVRYQQLLNKV